MKKKAKEIQKEIYENEFRENVEKIFAQDICKGTMCPKFTGKETLNYEIEKIDYEKLERYEFVKLESFLPGSFYYG